MSEFYTINYYNANYCDKIRVSQTRTHPKCNCFCIQDHELLVGDVFKYYFYKVEKSNFNYEKAMIFTETMRMLCGFKFLLDRYLEQWVEVFIRNPFLKKL